MADMLLPGFKRIDQPNNSCEGCAIDVEYRKRTSPDERIAMFGVTCYSAGCGGKIIVPVDTPLARANDPHTSKTAATKVKRASIKHHIMLTLATENPADNGGYAWTGTEIAAKNQDLRLNSITPRFAELRRAGRIRATTTVRNGELAWVLV